MIKKSIIALTFLCSVISNAQRSTSSPYSILGLGTEFRSETVEQSMMGGLGAAIYNPFHLNLTNPAAVADLKFTTYVFGLERQSLTIYDESTKQNSSSTRLSYFGFGTRIIDGFGFYFGMQPVSAVGYSLSNRLFDNEGQLNELTTYTGTGDVNRLYLGLGARLFKGFTVGAEIDYLFGSLENSIIKQTLDVYLATRNIEESTVRGNEVKLGAQYQVKLKEKLKLHLGASFVLPADLTVKGEEYVYSLSYSNSGSVIPRDTLNSSVINGKYKNPFSTTVGIGIGREREWYVGAEAKKKQPIEVTDFGNDTSEAYRYETSSRFSLGGFYTPKYNSLNSYWERVTYRAGVRLEKLGLQVNGLGTENGFTSIDDFGINFGVGLPISSSNPTNVNLGFEYGQRGTTQNGLIKENYFNLRLSLSFNDTWFRKRKID